MRIHYRLYDPYAKEPVSDENTQEQIDGDLRVGSIHPKLHPSGVKRWETTQGISIQGAYALKKRSNRLYFKIAKD
jgi:hypothetical protein